jgi:RHS repeat-associated protein
MKLKRIENFQRAFSAVLIPLYLIAATPEFSRAIAEVEVTITPRFGGDREERVAATATAPEQAPIAVNRTVPPVSPPVLRPQFSARPTTQEISMARVFEELLVPYGTPTDAENADLAGALNRFVNRKTDDDAAPIEEFLARHPASVWRVALLVNLGTFYRQHGYFSRALNHWEQAWELAKNEEQNFRIKMQADRAIGEMLQLNAWVGRMGELDRLFADLGDRPILGSATESITAAREGLAGMKDRPERSFKCGPFALQSIKRHLESSAIIDPVAEQARSTTNGISLAEVARIGREMGLDLEMARRVGHAPVPVPSVVHWKLDHYGAVLEHRNGKYLVEDLTFSAYYGRQLWISEAALNEEASGYFLVPAGRAGKEWKSVALAEGGDIYGRGNSTAIDPDNITPCDKKSCDSCGGTPMAQYSIHLATVSLNIVDTPVSYQPPVGPAVEFTVTYNQRDSERIAFTGLPNLGLKWNFNWLSYIWDNNSSTASAEVKRYVAGGGFRKHKLKSGSSTDYDLDAEGGSLVFVPSTKTYVLTHSDGSQQLFEQSTASSGWRRVLLKRIKDAAGNTVTLTYDSYFRLTAITDAVGQVTTISYQHQDPMLITKVTDPFNRFATFEYDGMLRLEKITDPVGITSQFTYDGYTDFIKALTTPYGTTTFTKYENGLTRSLLATDPEGNSEMVKTVQGITSISGHAVDQNAYPGPTLYDTSVSGSATMVQVPNTSPAMWLNNRFLEWRNTFYWTKKTYTDGSNYSDAIIYHWAHGSPTDVMSGVLESIKKPLESRVWFQYPNQADTAYSHTVTLRKPTRAVRLLDDGTYQVYEYDYNSKGNLTKTVDPLGRKFEYTYAANGIDLTSVKQTKTSPTQLLLTLGNYTSTHLPQTITDASGRVTSIGYNSKGQPTYITNPLNQTTTFLYTNNFLAAIDGPWTGTVDKTIALYDPQGRVKEVIRPDGWFQKYEYDNIDRVTKVTYPDTTFEQFTYKWLNLERVHDRKGRRVFKGEFDALGRPKTVTDLLGQVTAFGYCDCGSLDTLTDAKGQITSWSYDNQGRVTGKTYHGTSPITYTYENRTSRLKSVTDLKGQTKNYTYEKDNRLKTTTYTNPQIATPSVTNTWDTAYPRLTQILDGTGLTTFTYNSIPTSIPNPAVTGAGRLQSINGPVTGASDEVTFVYDVLGRLDGRYINGSGNNQVGYSYDTLGRLWQLGTTMGAFGINYVGNNSGRPSSVTYPNGQSINYQYGSLSQDYRLFQIWNKKNGGSTLSKFDYEYDVNGLITKWTQQADAATPTVYEFDYDPIDQLVGARAYTSGSPATSTKAWYYDYDTAGNRSREQAGTSGTTSTITKADFSNNLNQLEGHAGSNPLPVTFWGKVNEVATVTVKGENAKVDADHEFRHTVNLNAGNQTNTVVATDYGQGTGNVTTRNFVMNPQGGTARTLTYDNNGNLTTQVIGGTTTYYTWDAEDRLLSVRTGSQMSKFYYDGFSRRVKLEEGTYSGGVFTPTTSLTKKLIWVGGTIAEERNASDVVQKKFYSFGEWRNGVGNLYYARDHLGNLRELTDNGGTVRARYEYDPYGRRTKVSGDLEADWGFTGHYYHAPSTLHLAWFRAYDANLGRWISRDPIMEEAGSNLYAYVDNNPLNLFDIHGLDSTKTPQGIEITLDLLADELGIPLDQVKFANQLAKKLAEKGIKKSISEAHELIQAAKQAKKIKDTETLFKTCKVKDSKDFHKFKEKVKNKFKNQLKGHDNPDLLFDEQGNVVLQSVDGKVSVPTGLTIDQMRAMLGLPPLP